MFLKTYCKNNKYIRSYKELSITSSLTIETFKCKLKQYILNIENTSQYFWVQKKTLNFN